MPSFDLIFGWGPPLLSVSFERFFSLRAKISVGGFLGFLGKGYLCIGLEF